MLEATEILNASILIVDDQQANVLLLETMLNNAGYHHYTSTTDPRAVCALHQEHRYDLILLDLQMPGMDGFEVMEALKQIDSDGYLPVLVITAQPSHKLRALKAGAKDFVSKPFDLIEVQTRIHNMLEVRLLYKKLGDYNKLLEQTVLERTAELRESEARFKSFTELSSDWYWEQDAHGKFTNVSGPVFEMLGIGEDGRMDATGTAMPGRWNAAERALLDANIAARRPFLDFIYSRNNPDDTIQYLQVSGEPMFDSASRFIGYRGIGADVTDRMHPRPVR
jgi:PAS domain S-box-containing protein